MKETHGGEIRTPDPDRATLLWVDSPPAPGKCAGHAPRPPQHDPHPCITVNIISNSRIFCEGLTAVLRAYPYLSVVAVVACDLDDAAILPIQAGQVALLDAHLGEDMLV